MAKFTTTNAEFPAVNRVFTAGNSAFTQWEKGRWSTQAAIF